MIKLNPKSRAVYIIYITMSCVAIFAKYTSAKCEYNIFEHPDTSVISHKNNKYHIAKEKFSNYHYPLTFRQFGTSVNDSNDIDYINDSLFLKQHYINARWLMYCFCCTDTFFIYTELDYANLIPKYLLFGEMELILKELGTSSYSRINKTKPDYIFSIEPKYSDIYSLDFLNKLDHNKYGYIRNIFYKLIYSFKYPQKALGFRADLWNNYVTIYLDEPYSHVYPDNCNMQKAYKIFNNPFQPEIIKHVRNNSSHIHPWFLNEAKKRGMFDSVKYTPEWVEKEILLNKQKPKNCDEETIRTR